jgi:ABC-type lipoprotein export system ATPase subunit/bifunctional DNA-binding transcriptional regulator/antitoxin component of YhaV-PrlF toxin-antitoxin module
MSEAIIICESLVKIYKIADLEVLALQGLDLTVQKGELIGIVGASGSGKSTLMNVLGGLARPTAGRVIVNGQNLLKLSGPALDKYRQTQIGFVWQMGARNLISYLNVQDNVEFPMTVAGNKQPRQRALDLLEMVGLSERRRHLVSQLSGGEQLRVAIAVALANNPSILLADEPTGELDTTTAQTIYDALTTLNRELGQTILIVSHDPNIARQVNRVMAIRDGKTSSEMVRKQFGSKDAKIPAEQPPEDHFEELTIVDAAGRLQIPKAYRERMALGKRVRLEMVDDGVLIRPMKEDLPGSVTESGIESVEIKGRWKKWLNQFLKDGSS